MRNEAPYGLDILGTGICKTHQKKAGHFLCQDSSVSYFSGIEEKIHNGDAGIDSLVNSVVVEYNFISAQFPIAFNWTLFKTSIMQVNMPTFEVSDEKIEESYGQLEDIIRISCILYIREKIMGIFNIELTVHHLRADCGYGHILLIQILPIKNKSLTTEKHIKYHINANSIKNFAKK